MGMSGPNMIIRGRRARRAESGAIVFDHKDAPAPQGGEQDLLARVAALEERVAELEAAKSKRKR